MDVLIKEVMDVLTSDTELGNKTSEIRLRRLPDNPKKITDPKVTVIPMGGADIIGLQGAATSSQIEIKIFGRDDGDDYHKAIEAAQRIDELLLSTMKPSQFSNNSVARRWASVTGWQDVDQPQPRLIQLRNLYETRYWSAQRISALNN